MANKTLTAAELDALSMEDLLDALCDQEKAGEVITSKNEKTGRKTSMTLKGCAGADSIEGTVALALAQKELVKVEVKGLEAGEAGKTLKRPTPPKNAPRVLWSLIAGKNEPVPADVMKAAQELVAGCVVPAAKGK